MPCIQSIIARLRCLGCLKWLFSRYSSDVSVLLRRKIDLARLRLAQCLCRANGSLSSSLLLLVLRSQDSIRQPSIYCCVHQFNHHSIQSKDSPLYTFADLLSANTSSRMGPTMASSYPSAIKRPIVTLRGRYRYPCTTSHSLFFIWNSI